MNIETKPSNNRVFLKNTFIVFYYTLTGLITIPLAMWFAAGTIAESETDFPAPEFFWLIAIWGLGLAMHYIFKLKWLGMMISFLPVAYFIYLVIAASFT